MAGRGEERIETLVGDFVCDRCSRMDRRQSSLKVWRKAVFKLRVYSSSNQFL